MNPNQMHLQPPISNTPSVFAPVPQRQPHLQQYQQHPDTQPQSYAVSPSAPGTGQVARKTIAQFTQQPAKKVGHSTADYKARFLKAKSKYERANATTEEARVGIKKAIAKQGQLQDEIDFLIDQIGEQEKQKAELQSRLAK